MYYRKDYCPYLGAFMTLVQDYLQGKNVGDATDSNAMVVMRAFTEQRANNVVSDTVGRAQSLTLLPRMTLKGGELAVSFKVGEKKLFVIKDLFEFYANVQESKTASYGSATTLNHNINNFTDRGRKWIDYIGSIVKEEQAFERRLIEARSYSKKAVSKDGELALGGWTSCIVSAGRRGWTLRIGTVSPESSVSCRPERKILRFP